MMNPKKTILICIFAVWFCHLLTMHSYAIDIVDTINKYKDAPEKVEKLEKAVEDATKRADEAVKQAEDAAKRADDAIKEAEAATKQAEAATKQLNEYKQSQTSNVSFYIGTIIVIVISIYGLKRIVRRNRNLGNKGRT